MDVKPSDDNSSGASMDSSRESTSSGVHSAPPGHTPTHKRSGNHHHNPLLTELRSPHDWKHITQSTSENVLSKTNIRTDQRLGDSSENLVEPMHKTVANEEQGDNNEILYRTLPRISGHHQLLISSVEESPETTEDIEQSDDEFSYGRCSSNGLESVEFNDSHSPVQFLSNEEDYTQDSQRRPGEFSEESAEEDEFEEIEDDVELDWDALAMENISNDLPLNMAKLRIEEVTHGNIANKSNNNGWGQKDLFHDKYGADDHELTPSRVATPALFVRHIQSLMKNFGKDYVEERKASDPIFLPPSENDGYIEDDDDDDVDNDDDYFDDDDAEDDNTILKEPRQSTPLKTDYISASAEVFRPKVRRRNGVPHRHSEPLKTLESAKNCSQVLSEESLTMTSDEQEERSPTDPAFREVQSQVIRRLSRMSLEDRAVTVNENMEELEESHLISGDIDFYCEEFQELHIQRQMQQCNNPASSERSDSASIERSDSASIERSDSTSIDGQIPSSVSSEVSLVLATSDTCLSSEEEHFEYEPSPDDDGKLSALSEFTPKQDTDTPTTPRVELPPLKNAPAVTPAENIPRNDSGISRTMLKNVQKLDRLHGNMNCVLESLTAFVGSLELHSYLPSKATDDEQLLEYVRDKYNKMRHIVLRNAEINAQQLSKMQRLHTNITLWKTMAEQISDQSTQLTKQQIAYTHRMIKERKKATLKVLRDLL